MATSKSLGRLHIVDGYVIVLPTLRPTKVRNFVPEPEPRLNVYVPPLVFPVGDVLGRGISTLAHSIFSLEAFNWGSFI